MVLGSVAFGAVFFLLLILGSLALVPDFLLLELELLLVLDFFAFGTGVLDLWCWIILLVVLVRSGHDIPDAGAVAAREGCLGEGGVRGHVRVGCGAYERVHRGQAGRGGVGGPHFHRPSRHIR